MFGDLMGGRRGGQTARGADLRYNMEITLEDAFRGKTAQIRVPSTVSCEACNGSGAEGGAQPVGCQTCHGRGRVRAQQGFFRSEEHTSELQSLMRISYAVFCLKKKNTHKI